jgi:malate dehydrogenase (quinone)
MIFWLSSCKALQKDAPTATADVVLIGGGIMSATVASMLRELNPDLRMEVFERLSGLGEESSDAWNNAGTGHAAYCELNYTPELADGSIDIKKAVDINEAFELSRQYWTYLVKNKRLANPESFIHGLPHLTVVWGEKNIDYLSRRFNTLKKQLLFSSMEFSTNREEIREWVPLVVDGRDKSQKIAATRVAGGTDVNYGNLTRELFSGLSSSPLVHINLSHEVYDFERDPDGSWLVMVKDIKENKGKIIKSRFVFIGAGGAALTLLQKTKIPEGKGYAGFPVGGEWLVSDNPEIISQHNAKAYGKASLGAPPMSVPHLDTRYINGKKSILFGPFAVFSTKFLKRGSWLDVLSSVRTDNFLPMLEAGWHNIPLTRYLISQVLLSFDEKIAALREYYPNAQAKDWRELVAGQRVQIIKNDPKQGGILQFGTELVAASDGSIVALLGASPGASTAVKTALSVLELSFKDAMKSPLWKTKLLEILPSYGKKLSEHPELFERVHEESNRVLNLINF